jgi:hypothetical protein
MLPKSHHDDDITFLFMRPMKWQGITVVDRQRPWIIRSGARALRLLLTMPTH